MDNRRRDYRNEAQIERARGGVKGLLPYARRSHFIKSAELLLNVHTLDQDDYRDLAFIYHDIANSYFNDNNHEKAASYYLQGIQQFYAMSQRFKLRDSHCRKLIECYIDLADAYSHLYNFVSAHESLTHAMEVFAQIEIKTEEERNLGNPVNFQLFHAHFEKKLSSPYYLKSRVFKNHADLLTQHHNISSVNLSDLSMNESSATTEESVWEAFIKQLDENPAIAIPTAQIEDDDYRSASESFIKLAQDQYNKQLIKDAIKTLEEAIQALRKISQKTDADNEKLKAIRQQINTLIEPQPSPLSALSMYAQPRQAPNAPSANSHLDSWEYRDSHRMDF